MTTATNIVEELATAAHQGSDALERVLGGRQFPVVGNGWALFVFRGHADDVRLHLWVSGYPTVPPFKRVVGTDLWTLETDIQDGARIEYKLEVVKGQYRELIRDPLNETFAEDPFGSNSVVQGIAYTKPEWASDQPDARHGTVEDHHLYSEVFREERPWSMYVPARFRTTQHYPLLIFHDGYDYQRFSSLTTILDNLIHRLEIPPVLAVLIQSPNRLPEYGASELHARFLVDELLPHIEERFPLLEGPSDRCLIGASFGAVASLHAAWVRPGTFGKLLLQSGSFAFTDVGEHDLGPAFDTVVDFVNEFRKAPGKPANQIFLSAGIYESLIYFNRSLLPVLQSTGADVRLVEAQDGHNWENWRDRLRDGLTWLFPGPLWMFYE